VESDEKMKTTMCYTRLGNEELLTIDVALGQRNEELTARDIAKQWVDNKGPNWNSKWQHAQKKLNEDLQETLPMGFEGWPPPQKVFKVEVLPINFLKN
jgi:hypothetical protein